MLYEFYLAQPASVLLLSFTVIVPQVICGRDEVARGTGPTEFAVASGGNCCLVEILWRGNCLYGDDVMCCSS